MGIALILILAAIAVAFYFGIKFKWLNAFVTLGNGKDSHYERTGSTGNETTFNITPARSSRGALVCIGIGILLFLIPGIWLLGLIPLAIGLVVFPVASRYREKSTIKITADLLESHGNKWPLVDIVAVNVRSGSSFNTHDPGQAVYNTPSGALVYGSKSTSVMFTKVIARRVVERSYIVTSRNREGSQECVLSGGLTLTCAKNLCDELTSVIARQGVVS